MPFESFETSYIRIPQTLFVAMNSGAESPDGYRAPEKEDSVVAIRRRNVPTVMCFIDKVIILD